MKLVRSRVKNRKGCGISKGLGSGLQPLKRMPIVEWVRLLKETAVGSFTQKHSTVEVSNCNILLLGYKLSRFFKSHCQSILYKTTNVNHQKSKNHFSNSNLPMAFPWHLNKILNLYGGSNISCPSLITTLLLTQAPQYPGPAPQASSWSGSAKLLPQPCAMS